MEIVSDSPNEERKELDALNRFIKIIREQDERAMVLAFATFIEDTLGRLLVAYFRDCKATKELVQGFSAPLGTLGTRIKATFAFGLVTEEQYSDMEILRKVRNKFAHNWEGVSLEQNDIAALVGQLSGHTFVGTTDAKGKQRLADTMASCCVELFLFQARIESGKSAKAPDVSHRLQGIPRTK